MKPVQLLMLEVRQPRVWLFQLAPTIPLYGLDGTYGGPIGGGYSDRNNPVLMQDKNQWDNSHNSMIFGNAFAEWNILDKLVFRSSIGMDYNAFNQKNIESKIR